MIGSELKADRGTDVRDVSNGRLVADMDPEQNFGAEAAVNIARSAAQHAHPVAKAASPRPARKQAHRR